MIIGKDMYYYVDNLIYVREIKNWLEDDGCTYELNYIWIIFDWEWMDFFIGSL